MRCFQRNEIYFLVHEVRSVWSSLHPLPTSDPKNSSRIGFTLKILFSTFDPGQIRGNLVQKLMSPFLRQKMCGQKNFSSHHTMLSWDRPLWLVMTHVQEPVQCRYRGASCGQFISTSGQNTEQPRLIFLGHELQPSALLHPCLVPIIVKFQLTPINKGLVNFQQVGGWLTFFLLNFLVVANIQKWALLEFTVLAALFFMRYIQYICCYSPQDHYQLSTSCKHT